MWGLVLRTFILVVFNIASMGAFSYAAWLWGPIPFWIAVGFDLMYFAWLARVLLNEAIAIQAHKLMRSIDRKAKKGTYEKMRAAGAGPSGIVEAALADGDPLAVVKHETTTNGDPHGDEGLEKLGFEFVEPEIVLDAVDEEIDRILRGGNND